MADYIPQVDYTSRDYASIREDLLSLVPNFAPQWASTDATDFGVVLVELFSYMGDMLNYYIDRAANENFIQSATQGTTIRKLAKLYGYTPYVVSPSSTTVVFSNSSSSSIVVLSGTLLAAGSDELGSTIYFETKADVTVGANATASASVIQGQTISNETIGTSDGSVNQKFALSNKGVDLTSIAVSVAGKTYTYVDSLLYYGSNDKVFYADTDDDNVTYIYFGDGTTGAIPPNGNVISVGYRTCLGTGGNVAANAISTIVSSGYDSITISSSSATTNGTDSETVDSIRVNAPLFLRSGNRAVSMADYQNLAVNVSGISKARAVSQYFTQVIIFVMADNWTSPSSSLRGNVITALSNKVPPSTTLQVVSGVVVYPRIAITVNALPTYNVSVVSLAVKAKLLELFSFDNVDFGQRITKSALYGAINRSTVTGLDYITIDGLDKSTTAPTSQLSTGPNVVDDFWCASNEIPLMDPLNIRLTSGTGL